MAISSPELPPAGRPGRLLPLFLFAAGFVCAVLAAWLPGKMLPAFQDVYASFGTDLPLPTRWLMRYPQGLWAGPLAVLALAIAGRQRVRLAAAAACAIGVAALMLLAVAAYLPIVTAGAVV